MRAQPVIPLMAALPYHRLQQNLNPFNNVGLDYFGPMFVRVLRSTMKRWVLLVICLNTRAIHLELVYSLDTDFFILACRKFVSRRLKPAIEYSAW